MTKEKPGDGNVVEHLNFVGVIFSVLEAGIKDANVSELVTVCPLSLHAQCR